MAGGLEEVPDWVAFTRREVIEMARYANAIEASSMRDDDPARAALHLLKKNIAWAVDRQHRENQGGGEGDG